MRSPVLAFEPAVSLTMGQLTLLWREVYSNYPVPLPFTEDELTRFIRMSGLCLELSQIALIDGQPVGLSFAGKHEDQAWIGGFGVVPAHRRTGIGLAMMRAQTRVIDDAGVRGTRLEVIATNRARKLYAHAGFVDRRRLFSFNSPAVGTSADPLVTLSLDDLPALHRRLHTGASAAPWQRELESVMRAVERDQLDIVGWRGIDGISAYAVEQNRAGLTHLVDAVAECQASAEGLVASLAARSRGRRISLGDEPANSPIAKAFKRFGASPRTIRMEMVRMAGQASTGTYRSTHRAAA
ncbi:GNAT family N-acetyltransferase [uncultured Brevundimonas sp.]|uniref:GNAT family N-acetyltransferase n=1 Tax=uncultured Brevundimonas sp. TaxID=213418 RepID=UPI00260FF9C7|nr:GNAT family N-acetyltransferase [uncultured Brevundimonas sp.]